MRIQIGSFLAGGLLVAVGFALAQAPSWVRDASAGVAPQAPSGLTITSDDANPGRIIHWAFNAQQQLVSVVAHNVNADGVVTSQELKLLTLPRVR